MKIVKIKDGGIRMYKYPKTGDWAINVWVFENGGMLDCFFDVTKDEVQNLIDALSEGIAKMGGKK